MNQQRAICRYFVNDRRFNVNLMLTGESTTRVLRQIRSPIVVEKTDTLNQQPAKESPSARTLLQPSPFHEAFIHSQACLPLHIALVSYSFLRTVRLDISRALRKTENDHAAQAQSSCRRVAVKKSVHSTRIVSLL